MKVSQQHNAAVSRKAEFFWALLTCPLFLGILPIHFGMQEVVPHCEVHNTNRIGGELTILP